MKKSIMWHQTVLVNSKATADEKRMEISKLTTALESLDQRNSLRQAQIDLAIKEGKEEFDGEKYAIKRLCV